jgi:hypothetical protein
VRQCRDDCVQELSGAHAAHPRDGQGLAEAEAVELVHGHLAFEVVGLVGDQDDGLVGAAQLIGDLGVLPRNAIHDVGHEHDDVGLIHGDLRLRAHLRDEGVAVIEHQAAGVHQGEHAAAPFHIGVLPIAGGAGHVFDDGQALAHEPVKEGGLAHVGPAHQGNDRFLGHRSPSRIIRTARP